MNLEKYKMRFNYLLLLILVGCTVSKHKNEQPFEKTNSNNIILSSSKNVKNTSSNNKTKVIFKGENNLIVFEYLDSYFNSKNKKDLIIIEGNGNVIKFTLDNVVDNSIDSQDTLIIEGSSNYIELMNKYYMNNSVNDSLKSTIKQNLKITEIRENNIGFISDSSKIENYITNKYELLEETFQFYLLESMSGNYKACFYLGQLYETGIMGEMDLDKSEYYYLIAAKNQIVDAQLGLAILYENESGSFRKDMEKSIYWYTQASNNGNENAKKRLIELED